jgi:hypothetical protein
VKTLLLAFFLAAADGDSLSGRWLVHRSAGGNESQIDCAFTQKNNDLTGTCESDRGRLQLTGKLDGKLITWTHKSESPGGPVTVVYKGTVESTAKITGTLTAVEFAIEGEFTATRAKVTTPRPERLRW